MLDGHHINDGLINGDAARALNGELHRSYNIPDERSNTYFFVTKIKFLNGLKERRELFVLYHGDDAGVHLGPCVGATAGFTAVGSATLYLFEEREALDTQYVQHIFDTAGIGLVENNHYTFHKK